VYQVNDVTLTHLHIHLTHTYSKWKSCREWHSSSDGPVSVGELPSKL